MIYDRDQETIVAQCTAKGAGALALVRVCGQSAFDIVHKVARLPSKKSLIDMSSHCIEYGAVVDEKKQIIDRVLFFIMRAPRTFTGQDTIEISCHNNQFIIDRIIACLIFYGARLAQNGEFSKRAFLSNKIDLVQAEAINELIHASSQQALDHSLAQLEGTLSSWIARIEKMLIHALALANASFEFLEEENVEFDEHIQKIINQIQEHISRLKKSFNQHTQIREGIRIALIGSVNAGKSSLFNAMLAQKRAIVSTIPGTTRDVIEAGIYIDGLYWTLVDTAGLRKTEDSIEQEGITRSIQEAHKADIVILVVDSARALHEQEIAVYNDLFARYQSKIILVANKADIAAEYEKNINIFEKPYIAVSCLQLDTIGSLFETIKEKIRTTFCSEASPFLLNKRHMSVLAELETKLSQITTLLVKPVAYELVCVHIQDALESLTMLTGKTISEDALNAVFKEFCVGK